MPIPERPRTWRVTDVPPRAASNASRRASFSSRRPTSGEAPRSVAESGAASPTSSRPARRRRRTSAPLGRWAGSRCSRARHKASRSGGTPWARADGEGGSTVPFIRRTSAAAPRTGARPTSASNRTAPTPYQSHAAVGAAPAACSGAMYEAVPTIQSASSASSPARDRSIATPKSSNTTRPSGVTRTFDGLMSRCTLPAAWSACTPRASWPSAARRRSGSAAPRARTWATTSMPCTSSIVKKTSCSSVATSLVESYEVRVMDVGGRPELLLEAAQGRGAEVPEPLDRDGRSALFVERLEDRPHAARADAAPDAIPRGARPASEPRRQLRRGLRSPRAGHRPSDPVRGRPLDAGAQGVERRLRASCGVLADPPTLAGYRRRHSSGARGRGSSWISRSPPYTGLRGLRPLAPEIGSRRFPNRTARRRRGDARGRARDRGRRSHRTGPDWPCAP